MATKTKETVVRVFSDGEDAQRDACIEGRRVHRGPSWSVRSNGDEVLHAATDEDAARFWNGGIVCCTVAERAIDGKLAALIEACSAKMLKHMKKEEIMYSRALARERDLRRK
jgi:hypothetical protein